MLRIHEVVFVTQIRSLDVGRDAVIKATGLRESAMLTEDENIVEIKFAVQYRLTDARAYLFESKNPTDAVMQAAETAVNNALEGEKKGYCSMLQKLVDAAGGCGAQTTENEFIEKINLSPNFSCFCNSIIRNYTYTFLSLKNIDIS